MKELQEVQEISFEYLKYNGVKAEMLWVTNDLSVLPSSIYDFVIINHIMYCFNDSEYNGFMKHTKRILKPDGIMIMTAELISELQCLRNSLANNKLLRWILNKSN